MYKRLFTVLGGLLAWTTSVQAQDSSINTFSPYSYYGLGDLAQPGTAYQRAMGGIGLGFRSPLNFNPQNPASYSAVLRKSFVFDVGMEGQNFYAKQGSIKNSYNTFNIRNVSFMMPLYKGLGFGFNMSPVSNVGYRIKTIDDSQLSSIGAISRNYSGEGGISEFKAGLGMEIMKGLSLGVDFIYWHGNLYTDYSTTIQNFIEPSNIPNSITGRDEREISKVFFGMGIQYNILNKEFNRLTLGVNYRPGAKANVDMTDLVFSGSDTTRNVSSTTNIKVASNLGIGLFYQDRKIGAGLDYVYENWSNKLNEQISQDKIIIGFRSTNSVKLGFEYTPNRMDIRHPMKRVSYRIGLRYQDVYFTQNGHKQTDRAITAGLGIPLKVAGLTNINVGMEYGTRGKTSFDQIRESYFKFSIGVSLFGQDDWFKKYKYR